jgi:hypothetical protein
VQGIAGDTSRIDAESGERRDGCTHTGRKEEPMVITDRITTVMGFGLLASTLSIVAGCSSGPRGTYRDAMGAVILELRSGGNARFTFSGDVEECTYSSNKATLTLTCKGTATPTRFTILDDGSLTGPAESVMPPLG